MKTYEVLESALALIEDEKNWAQGDYKIGNALCAEGACLVAGGVSLEWDGQRFTYFDGVTNEYVDALNALGDCLSGSVHIFNDSSSHPEVVVLFQEAIRNEKAKAGIPIALGQPEAVSA